MSNTTVIYPIHYRVIRCEGGKWYVKSAKLCSPNNISIGLENAESYGVSTESLLVSLFRINGGKAGYYIVNLQDKKYYYCGLRIEDVQATFLDLGVGRAEN